MLINLLLWLIDKIDFFSGKQQENEYWIGLGRVENIELLEYVYIYVIIIQCDGGLHVEQNWTQKLINYLITSAFSDNFHREPSNFNNFRPNVIKFRSISTNLHHMSRKIN